MGLHSLLALLFLLLVTDALIAVGLSGTARQLHGTHQTLVPHPLWRSPVSQCEAGLHQIVSTFATGFLAEVNVECSLPPLQSLAKRTDGGTVLTNHPIRPWTNPPGVHPLLLISPSVESKRSIGIRVSALSVH